PARRRRRAAQAARVPRRGAADGDGGGVRRADRVRGPHRAAHPAAALRARQPPAGAGGAAGRRHLPPRRRHPGAQRHRPRRALGRRHHLVLRRAVLRLPPAHAPPERAVTALLAARDLAFTYPAPEGAGPPFGLADVSFDVRAGEVLGVIGPNSAGKTTLMRLLTRVLAPAAGTLTLDGRPLGALPRAEVAREIAVVPQDLPAGLPFT